jgi:hypothetical protein
MRKTKCVVWNGQLVIMDCYTLNDGLPPFLCWLCSPMPWYLEVDLWEVIRSWGCSSHASGYGQDQRSGRKHLCPFYHMRAQQKRQPSHYQVEICLLPPNQGFPSLKNYETRISLVYSKPWINNIQGFIQ